MKHGCWIIWLLILGSISTNAQTSPEKIYQGALLREATLDYSYEDDLNEENQNRITIVKQKRNSDGSVWRVRETKGIEDLSRRYYSFDTKIIYNSEGCIDLWISQYEIMGIVTQDEIPQRKIGKDSTLKMTSVTYDGRNCWKIIEHQICGVVCEIIIDKKHEFILATKDFDASGKLLFSTHKKNINFNPVFTEDDFRVPSNAKLRYANNTREYMELSVKRVSRHSNFVKNRRGQKESGVPKTHGKIRQQWDKITRNETFDFVCQKAPWFLMPIAFCTIGIVIWKKRK